MSAGIPIPMHFHQEMLANLLETIFLPFLYKFIYAFYRFLKHDV